MKKVIIFSSIILILFGGIVFLTKYQQQEASKDNPYGKDDLHPETIKLLEDPNYQELITSDELEKKLANKEDVTVYFFSPTCSHCKETTPILMPIAKKEGVDIKQYNVLEFDRGWEEFAIEATPTLIHFENGKEKARLKGGYPEEAYKEFFKENIK